MTEQDGRDATDQAAGTQVDKQPERPPERDEDGFLPRRELLSQIDDAIEAEDGPTLNALLAQGFFKGRLGRLWLRQRLVFRPCRKVVRLLTQVWISLRWLLPFGQLRWIFSHVLPGGRGRLLLKGLRKLSQILGDALRLLRRDVTATVEQ